MWKKIKYLFIKEERGTVTVEYLILALLLTGTGILVVNALTGELAATHNQAVNSVTAITGSGF